MNELSVIVARMHDLALRPGLYSAARARLRRYKARFAATWRLTKALGAPFTTPRPNKTNARGRSINRKRRTPLVASAVHRFAAL